MSIRIKNIIICIISLFIGGLLYVIFRENTILGKAFDEIELIIDIRKIANRFPFKFHKIFLPDFLWELSLCCGLTAIGGQSNTNTLICCIIGFATGVLWETLQFTEIATGTGDIVDIVIYLLASSICLVINLKGDKK